MFKRFMDFPDVPIDYRFARGTFFAKLRGNARDLLVPGAKPLGRFVIVQTLIMTGVTLTAESLQSAQLEMLPQHGPS